ncbi:hypothetical protein [uncultured Maribacter sp.]|uniref:hypothetical protein n=1 Tax=uncultured Maribacter sp. TaxID=431308 RepID=UPI00262FFEA8|nr:hypothetical protein [uncultured Maribacter sp.]
MKTLLYKYTTLILFIAPLLVSAHNGKLKGKYTKEKTIKKEYSVNSDALLKIANSYGNLNITSWNENRILIEVHIKTNGNNKEKVQKKLESITVNFEGSSSMVSAKTIFNNSKSSWGWNWGNSGNVNMQINYTIKMPIKNRVNLSNDYGNIILDRVDGHAKISCDYGRLDIGELRGRNNTLNFDYTSKSNINYINSGTITADYSGFTIEKAGNLIIKADYTNASISYMKNLQYSSDYGKIDIGEVNNIEGNGDYINVKLGTIHGNVQLVSDYGALQIKEMAEDAGNLSINSDYTGIKIGYSPKYHFNFDISTEYAGVSGKDEFEINLSTEKSNKKHYKGYHGSPNSGHHVSIDSEYGSVSFYKNN